MAMFDLEHVTMMHEHYYLPFLLAMP